MLGKAIAKIREQSDNAKDYNVQYCAVELIGIIKNNPDKAELILSDLDNPDMSIDKCEKKIGEYFRKNRSDAKMSGPIKVISDFYGLNIDPEKTAELMYGNGIGQLDVLPVPGRINVDDFI